MFTSLKKKNHQPGRFELRTTPCDDPPTTRPSETDSEKITTKHDIIDEEQNGKVTANDIHKQKPKTRNTKQMCGEISSKNCKTKYTIQTCMSNKYVHPSMFT